MPSPFRVETGGRLSCAALMGEYKHHRFVVQLSAREALPPHRQADATVHVSWRGGGVRGQEDGGIVHVSWRREGGRGREW